MPDSAASARANLELETGGELLANGIRLPAEWPPRYGKLSGEPMSVPYLANPPALIPIDVGRQLLVDDFLVAETDLRRVWHTPDYHPASPVLRPDRTWERQGRPSAMVFSDGVWYDPQARLFKLWYTAPEHTGTCYAVSQDGIHWEKPDLDIKPGTNLVLEAPRDSVTVWLDHEERDPQQRYKLMRAHGADGKWRVAHHVSADGMHWSDIVAESGPSWDRTTVFWNPFRRKWVYSVRGHEFSRGTNFRVRLYHEHDDWVLAARWQMESDRLAEGEWADGEPVVWVGADRLDLRHPDPAFAHVPPELYNLDAVAYESILLGLFTIWQGPSNEDCQRLGIEKRNQVFLGVSRDGFHWDRPNRRAFLAVDAERPDAWNRGNVQSAGGGCLVVGDKLYFYCSGRSYGDGVIAANQTGLALLRRDGFASLDAGTGGGQMVTHPLRFRGSQLFVNVDAQQGELRAELLDAEGHVVPGFSLDRCIPVSVDTTIHMVEWQGAPDLATVAGRPLRIRFHLINAKLFAFWVSPDVSGASYGYVAAGGPGFSGPVDTVGAAAYPGRN